MDAEESSEKPSIRLCEECKQKSSKYRCPGCSLATCSLSCVKAHKLRTACTGKRSATHFVPLSGFDDKLLRSDYNFLQEIVRLAESAQRSRAKQCGHSLFRFPSIQEGLCKAAKKRRTRLLLLPSGMSKMLKNHTRYNKWQNFISWTIEWRFNPMGVILMDHRVHEMSTIRSVIKRHLQPGPWNHQLRQFCEEPLDSLKFFIQKDPKIHKSPFRELGVDEPIGEQLRDIVIVEYPVIHVSLPSSSYGFEVIEDFRSVRSKRDILKGDDEKSEERPKGVMLREEEINDDDGSDPPVLDFAEHVNSQEEGGSDWPPKDMEFDFDEGLLDAYSDMLSQMNPDDFLEFGGEFFGEPEAAERGSSPPFSGELEEGEISPVS